MAGRVASTGRRAGSSRVFSLALLSLFFCIGLSEAVSAGDYAEATKDGVPNFAVMECGGDAFWDPRNGGECWTCGGENRTVLPVDGDKACQADALDYAPATRLTRNTVVCPKDSFPDPRNGGECWSCPAGTRRSFSAVTSDRACLRDIEGDEKTASYEYDTGSLLKACKKGTFPKAGTSKCYDCPSGYSHNPLLPVGTKGVCFTKDDQDELPAKKISSLTGTRCERGFFDPIDGGSCWSCPKKFARFVTSVKSEKACIAVSEPSFHRATFVKKDPVNLRKVKSGAAKLGCGQYGEGSFFDLRDGGTCWSCPASNPMRTIYPVDSGRACATATCGVEGGRPCYVWERFPSCDPGLVEDPIKNQCVQPRNLACVAFVGAVKGVKQAIEQANAAGEALQDEAIERIPGMREVLRFLENQNEQVMEQAGRLTNQIDFSEVTDEFQKLVIANEDLIVRMGDAATIMRDSKGAVEDILLDPELVCRFDSQGANERLRQLGIADALGFGRASHSGDTAVAGNSSTPSKMSFDVNVEVPWHGVDWHVGVQFVTDFDDESAWSIMHGGSKSFELSDDDKIKVGGVSLALGWAYAGVDNPCATDVYSWGVPVSFSGFLGIGFSCAGFGGLAITIIGADYNFSSVVTPTPAGAVPVPTPGQWELTWPKPSIEGGIGYEGAWKISEPNSVRAGVF